MTWGELIFVSLSVFLLARPPWRFRLGSLLILLIVGLGG